MRRLVQVVLVALCLGVLATHTPHAQTTGDAPAKPDAPAAPAKPAKPAASSTKILIAADTQWATEATLIDSGVAGPTVAVVSGFQGTGHAAIRAAKLVEDWPLAKGKLWVLPEANKRGCITGRRDLPGLPANVADLDACFPEAAGEPANGTFAAALLTAVVAQKPEWVVTLNEAEDYAAKTPELVRLKGATVAACGGEAASAAAKRMCAEAGGLADTDDKNEQWKVLAQPPVRSLAAAAAFSGAKGVGIVTCRKDSVGRRGRMLRVALAGLLDSLGMVKRAEVQDKLIPAAALKEATVAGVTPPRLAVYDDGGTGSVTSLTAAIAGLANSVIVPVCTHDIGAGALSQFDAVVFGGGNGSRQGTALGVAGRAKVVEFVRGGGGYLGVCAGAYLASAHYSWSLGILDAAVLDTKNWARGSGDVALEFWGTGRELYGKRDKEAKTSVRYNNGPILAAANKADIPDFEILALFRGEVTKKGVPGGVMPGQPAIVRGEFGKGRVLVSSPHPEQTKGLEWVIAKSAGWLCRVDDAAAKPADAKNGAK